MPDDHRPPKRTRLPEADPGLHVSELTSSQGITDFEQHEDSWLPDGNIALVVNQTTAFRIYRGLIACQPTVFEDMFTASTSNSDELFDACPAVHLSDSPQNLAHLLRILLPKSQRLYHGTSPRTFHEISAVIRLVHKYHVQDVQDQTLASLQIGMLSSNFDDWLVPPSVVSLARLTNTPMLLPGALYTCSYLGGGLLDGWKREDGTVEYLSTDDLRRCLDAHRVLARSATLLPACIFASPATRVHGCKTAAQCTLARQCALVRMVSSEMLAKGWKALASWEGGN